MKNALRSRLYVSRRGMLPILICSAYAMLAADARAAAFVKIKDETSPNGKFILEGVANNEYTVHVEVKSKAAGKAVGQFSISEFSASDSRDTISAVWKKDSSAFALNITEGNNVTRCRVFAERKGSWESVELVEREIDKVREKANTEGGKSLDYLKALAWLPNDRLKLSYYGNMGTGYQLVFHLVRAGKTRLAFIETIPPKPKPQPQVQYEDYVFSVVAGGKEGSADGAGAAAQFKSPQGIAVDANGNIFVGDQGNHLVRKISRDGVVETLAGSAGEHGCVDGSGKAARFWSPAGIGTDPAGNVYVADSSSQTIRKVTPQGVVSTLAGSAGVEGDADGTGSAARFRYPTGVAVDKSGNVYVADQDNYVIRKITPAGAVTTIAGLAGKSDSADGQSKSARFIFPSAVALDDSGNLFVADKLTIRKIDANANVTTVAGSPESEGSAQGPSAVDQFSNARSIAINDVGDLFIADDRFENIRRITPKGTVTTIRDVNRNVSSPIKPTAVAVASKDQIYVVDEDACAILVGRPAEPSAVSATTTPRTK